GALVPRGAGRVDRASSSAWSITARASAGAARAESELVEKGVGGARLMVGGRKRGFSVGPEVEWLAGHGWRVASAVLSARLGTASGTIRPFGQVSVGGFDWRHPGIVPDVC